MQNVFSAFGGYPKIVHPKIIVLIANNCFRETSRNKDRIFPLTTSLKWRSNKKCFVKNRASAIVLTTSSDSWKHTSTWQTRNYVCFCCFFVVFCCFGFVLFWHGGWRPPVANVKTCVTTRIHKLTGQHYKYNQSTSDTLPVGNGGFVPIYFKPCTIVPMLML